MSKITFKLEPLLQQHNISLAALAQRSGLAEATLTEMLGESVTLELEALSRIMDSFEWLTGVPIGLEDLLERTFAKHEQIAREQGKLRPISLETLKALIPDWTPEEKAHNERVWERIEAEKRAAAERGDSRLREVAALFKLEEDADTPAEESAEKVL